VRRTSLAAALLILACVGSGEPSQPSSPSYHVLFIGNSLTAANDLPHTVAALAATVQESIAVEAVTRPNLAIIDHINGSSNAMQVLQQGRWDLVVLQQGPTSQQIGRDTLILAAKMLEPSVAAAGGKIAQLMVWPAAADLSSFDGVLQSCKDTASAVAGICLPAGQAWRSAWAIDPSLPFYGPDGFHPSELGTYLAALVVYEGITGHSAETLPDQAYVNGRLLATSVNTVRLLQQVAHETVLAY
jgi:hypothetical protein